MKKQDLLHALEIVKPGLASKEIIEQTTSFAFMGDRVVTYNDEISISHTVEGLNITGAVKAEEMYQFLRKIKIEDIDLKVTDSEILFQSGRSKAGLTLYQNIILPLEEISQVEAWKDIPDNFLKALKYTMAVCSRNFSNPALTCVHINESGFLEGSDNHRILRHYTDEGSVPTFLIPATSVREVIKMNPTMISLDGGWVHLKNNEGTILSCRIYDDVYPNTSPYLEVSGKKITFPLTILNILEKASVFSKREIELDAEVFVSFKKNRIKISSKSEAGWFEEEVNIQYTGETLSFTIDPGLMKDILEETKEGEYTDNLLKFEGEEWIYVVSLRADNPQ